MNKKNQYPRKEVIAGIDTKTSAWTCGYNACLEDLAMANKLPQVEYKDLLVWRARFAGIAMNALIGKTFSDIEPVVKRSVEIADALLEELTK